MEAFYCCRAIYSPRCPRNYCFKYGFRVVSRLRLYTSQPPTCATHVRLHTSTPKNPLPLTSRILSLFFLPLASFNREIAGVRWPPRLSKLEFCGELTQRIQDVALPPTITHLSLLGDFDQPVHAVRWPAGLTTVRFGDRFRQRVDAAGVAWPASLRKVFVGRGHGKLYPSECGGGGGPAGGGLEEPHMAATAKENVGGLPPSCQVVLHVNDEDGDGVDDDGESSGGGDAAEAAEGAGAIAPADAYHGRLANEDGHVRPGAGAGAEGEGDNGLAAPASPGDGGLADLDGFYADDEGQSGWGGDEEGGDGAGLDCVDVFGFEDGAWDMEDPWGSY